MDGERRGDLSEKAIEMDPASRSSKRKALDRTYWVATSILSVGMIVGGIQELRYAPELLEAARRLGYPDSLLTLLGTAKLVGAPLLLVQKFPHLKEWVYAGFAFDFGGAIASHAAAGDTLVQTLPALCCAALLAISYGSYRARCASALRGKVA